MYIPTWILITGVIVLFFILRNKSNGQTKMQTVESIENNISDRKNRLFSLEHFDSPHFIDVQNDFDVMEANYLRLKTRFVNDKEKMMEIVQDWLRYVTALIDIKDARIILDVDMSDDSYDNFIESNKEPVIIKEEVEKKFKKLLGKDYQNPLPDYFERQEKAKPNVRKKEEMLENKLEKNSWSIYYLGERNYIRMVEAREKEKIKNKQK